MNDEIYTKSGVTIIALMPFLNGDALIGAFMGATLYTLSSSELSIAKRVGYFLISIFAGYTGSYELASRFDIKSISVSAFICSTFAVGVLLVALDGVKKFDLAGYIKERKK